LKTICLVFADPGISTTHLLFVKNATPQGSADFFGERPPVPHHWPRDQAPQKHVSLTISISYFSNKHLKRWELIECSDRTAA